MTYRRREASENLSGVARSVPMGVARLMGSLAGLGPGTPSKSSLFDPDCGDGLLLHDASQAATGGVLLRGRTLGDAAAVTQRLEGLGHAGAKILPSGAAFSRGEHGHVVSFPAVASAGTGGTGAPWDAGLGIWWRGAIGNGPLEILVLAVGSLARAGMGPSSWARTPLPARGPRPRLGEG